MSSLTMPSTPSSRRSCIWPGSFTVQTWTGRPSSWAQESIRRSARAAASYRICAQAGALGTALPGSPRRRGVSEGLARPHGRAQPWPQRGRARRGRRSRTSRWHPGQGAGSRIVRTRVRLRTVGLRVDVDTYIGPARQHIAEQRDQVRSPDAGGTDLSPGQRPNRTGPVGHPVQPVVVEHDQDVVGGHLHVGLEVAVAELDGPCKRPSSSPAHQAPRRGGRSPAARRAQGTDGPRLIGPSRSSCTDRHRAVDPTRQPGDCQAAEGVTWRSEIACPMTKAGNQVKGLDPPRAPQPAVDDDHRCRW